MGRWGGVIGLFILDLSISFQLYFIIYFRTPVLSVQGNYISLVDNPCAKVPHMQSSEQRGGHQPRARKRVHQRGLGAGDTGKGGRGEHTHPRQVRRCSRMIINAC